jgi:16S rRNA (cytosine967-C5)-methyltransferase
MDAVIADVPCSGYGIIRKKPDIRYKDPASMKELPQLQLAILKNQASYVKAGGVLLYSTCTLVRQENEAVVEAFLKENPNFTLEPLPLPAAFPENTSGMLALVPGQYDTDGFFICRMRRMA